MPRKIKIQKHLENLRFFCEFCEICGRKKYRIISTGTYITTPGRNDAWCVAYWKCVRNSA